MSGKSHRKHKSAKSFPKIWVVGAGVVLGIIFAVFLGNEFIVQLPKAKQAQAQLEIEFNSISPLSKASIVKHGASHKTSQALVDSTYLTDAKPIDIFNYYDGQLIAHGWKPNGASEMTDWGKDLGGRSAYYCKGDYSAQLQYAGEKANYGWTYALSVSWGLNDCKAKGGWVKQTLPISLLFTALGAFFLINGSNMAYNAWTKNSTEYANWFHKWRQQMIGISPSKSFLSQEYLYWNARVVSPFLLALGLFFVWAGVYNLWRNIFGG